MTPLNSEIKAPGGQSDPNFSYRLFRPRSRALAAGKGRARTRARNSSPGARKGAARRGENFILQPLIAPRLEALCAPCSRGYSPDRTGTKLVPILHIRC